MMAVNAIHQRRRCAVASVGAMAAGDALLLLHSLNLQGATPSESTRAAHAAQKAQNKPLWFEGSPR